MPNNTQLNFILNFVDRMSAPAKGACSTVQNALKVANSGFDSMRNGALGVASAWYTMQKMVNPAEDYYKALGEVKSLSVAQNELDKLGNSAMDYAQKYGGGVSSYIRSAYDIQSAINGLADGELSSFTNAANVTAKATKATAAEMTNYLGTMYGVFEKDALKVGKAQWADDLMGKTALAVKKFKTTGSGMSAAFTNIGSSATQMGYSLNEQIAVLGTLQTAMPGERAGTAYASFVRGLAKADGLSQKTGLSFLDADKKAIPIYEVIDKLKTKYGHLDVMARKRVLGQMFGSDEAVKTIDALWDKTDSLKNSVSEIAQIKGLDYAHNMANNMTSPLDRLKGLFEVLSIKISKKLLPVVEAIASVIGTIITYIIDFITPFSTLNKLIGWVAISVVGFTGALSALLALVGLAKMVWGGLLMTIAYGTKVYLLSAFVVKALGTALSWSIAKIKSLTLWSKIATLSTHAWATISQLVTNSMIWQNTVISIQMLKLKLLSVWQKINALSIIFQNGAYQAMIIVMNLNYLGILKQIGAYALQKISILSTIAIMGLMNVAMGAMTVLQWALNVAMLACPLTWIILGITALIGIIALCVIYWDEIKTASITAWNSIVSGLKWCWELLKSFGEWIADIFVGYFNFWQSIGSTLFNGVIAGLSYCWELLKNFGQWISSIFSNTLSNTLNVFNSLWSGLISGAQYCFSLIQPIFENILSIWNSIGGIWENVTGFFGSTELDSTINKTVNIDATSQNPKLASDLVRPNLNNSKSVSQSINNNTNWGGVKINVAGGMTPGDLAKWGALQA